MSRLLTFISLRISISSSGDDGAVAMTALAGMALLEVDDKDDSVHLTIDQDDLTSWAGSVPGTSAK